MRFILSALVLVFSFTAFAAPQVGDKIHRKGLFTSKGQSGSVSMDSEVISYDGTARTFLVRNTVTVGGEDPQVTDSQVAAADMISRELVSGIMSSCANYGGSLADLTVLGEVYHTCALPVDNGTCKGTTWIADVPFGTLATDFTCPSENIDRLVLPVTADQGGEFSFAWGK